MSTSSRTPNTHLAIDQTLCGAPVLLEEGHAIVDLSTDTRMAADGRGLVHGGFVFGAADYAAMLAVNDPLVVLGKAEVKFTAPTVVGQAVRLEARVTSSEGKKRLVEVEGRCGAESVFAGTFTCIVPAKHVLDRA